MSHWRRLPRSVRLGRPRNIKQATTGRPRMETGRDPFCICGAPLFIGTDGNGRLIEACPNPRAHND